jgi:hypothetical protein
MRICSRQSGVNSELMYSALDWFTEWLPGNLKMDFDPIRHYWCGMAQLRPSTPCRSLFLSWGMPIPSDLSDFPLQIAVEMACMCSKYHECVSPVFHTGADQCRHGEWQLRIGCGGDCALDNYYMVLSTCWTIVTTRLVLPISYWDLSKYILVRIL